MNGGMSREGEDFDINVLRVGAIRSYYYYQLF